MRSINPRLQRQSGFGLVDVLVGLALIAVAMVFLLGSLSSVVVGAHVAERRTIEERLARNQLETSLSQPAPDCSSYQASSTVSIQPGESYSVVGGCTNVPGVPRLIEYHVVASDAANPGSSVSLSARRVIP